MLSANALQRSPSAGPPNEPVTYYGRPALKPSPYGWIVALYVFIGGLAGAAQILAAVIDLIGNSESDGVILGARALALAGAIAGGVLLILELHTRQRFLNMLRIFRPTSPMSIGSYVLVSFGFWSLLALVFELSGPRWLALVCSCLGAVAGWLMMTYTAALLAATSTPLWAAAPRALAVRFAGSAMATGAAALCIIAVALGSPLTRALSTIAIAALAVELVTSIIVQSIYRAEGVNSPLRDLRLGVLHMIGVQLCGDVLPIALYAWATTNPHGSSSISLIASLLVLAGGFLMRGVTFLAGNQSARRPQDYFHFARPPQHSGAS